MQRLRKHFSNLNAERLFLHRIRRLSIKWSSCFVDTSICCIFLFYCWFRCFLLFSLSGLELLFFDWIDEKISNSNSQILFKNVINVFFLFVTLFFIGFWIDTKMFRRKKNFWKNWTKKRFFEKNEFLLLADLSKKDDIFRNWLINFKFENERSIIFITKKFNHFSETDKNWFFEIVLILIFDLFLFFSIRAEIVIFDKRIRFVKRINFVSLNEKIPSRETNCEFHFKKRIKFQTNFKKFV